MASRLNRLSEWVFEKSGPRLTVLFVSGDDPASVEFAEEVGRANPGCSRVLVSWGQVEEKRFRGVSEFIGLDPRRPWRSLWRLRRSLFRRRIERAAFRLKSSEPLVRRWGVAFVTLDLLIFNEDGESHLLAWKHPVAAWRFLRGEPVADVRRPTSLAFLREWIEWGRVLALLSEGRLRRPRGSNTNISSFGAGREGCAMLCLPGTDAEQLDGAVRNREEAEIVATSEALLPGSEIVEQLRQRLHQPGVWLVCTRANFKHLLGEGWAPHRRRESGTFCLGATSSLFAFRRDIFLELGGLAAFEKQLPRHGWAALSLRAWLRGYKTVYAGDIEFRPMRAPSLGVQRFAGPPLAPLVAACDELSTKARLLHRYARQQEFRNDYRHAVRQLSFPAGKGKRDGRLTPLVEEGAVILQGRENGQRLRLAVLVPELPYRASGAGAARIHNLLRRVASECDVYLFSYAEKASESQTEALLEYCARLVLIQPATFALPQRSLPAGVGRYQTASMQRHLEVLLEDWRIPLVHVESTALAMAAAWLAQAPVVKLLSAPQLQFAIHSQLKKSRLGRSRRRPRLDAARWRRYELGYVRYFDCVVTASQPDSERLAQTISSIPVRVVQNGVDLEHFRSVEPQPEQDEVLFVAEFDDFANISACDVLLRKIWPRVRASRPAARLTVVAGGGYREHWRRRFRRSLPEMSPEVTVLGHVGDLKPLYERSSAVILPALGGNGASPRVLEALAMRRAVVATKAACEGLALEPGRDLLVAEDAAEFAVAISSLLADVDLRRRLGECGRACMESSYDWSRSLTQQLEIYEELLRRDVARSSSVRT